MAGVWFGVDVGSTHACRISAQAIGPESQTLALAVEDRDARSWGKKHHETFSFATASIRMSLDTVPTTNECPPRDIR
jgi:hypothetical protein